MSTFEKEYWPEVEMERHKSIELSDSEWLERQAKTNFEKLFPTLTDAKVASIHISIPDGHNLIETEGKIEKITRKVAKKKASKDHPKRHVPAVESVQKEL